MTSAPTSTRHKPGAEPEEKINYKNTGLTGPAPTGMTSHETILQLIGATTTATGLTVTATLDTGSYPIGIKISNRAMAALPITRDEFHGDWNYTLHPTHDTPEPA